MTAETEPIVRDLLGVDNMHAELPALGVRFDVDKIGEGTYGAACWAVLWRAIPPARLIETHLWEGDTAASMAGSENVFCIALQSANAGTLEAARSALQADVGYGAVAAQPMFVEGRDCLREPLVAAGTMDAAGQLVGDAWNARAGVERASQPPIQKLRAPTPIPEPPPAPKPTETMDIEARDIRAAWSKVFDLKEAGYVVLSEEVLDAGTVSSAWAKAPTLAEAVAKARAKVPHDEAILNEFLIPEEHSAIEVEAFDEKEARRKAELAIAARSPYPSSWSGSAVSVSVKRRGAKGLFGLGKRPSAYQVAVLKEASAGFEYGKRAHIRAVVQRLSEAEIALKAFWKDGGPIKKEALYSEYRAILEKLVSDAKNGDLEAKKAVASIIRDASLRLTDRGELFVYHGYQRQQVAAEILGLCGEPSSIAALEAGKQLQDEEGGRGDHSTFSTKSLVINSINAAIGALRGA